MKFLLFLPLLFTLTGVPDMQVWELPTKDVSEKRYVSMVMRGGKLYSKLFIDYGCGNPLALLMTGSYEHNKDGQTLMYAVSDEMGIGDGCKVVSTMVILGTISKDGKFFDTDAAVISSCRCKDKSKNKDFKDEIGGRWRLIRHGS